MFHSSTQKQHWLFSSQQHLTRMRAETNASYCQKHSEAALRKGCQFITSSEEEMLALYYMKKLFEFCNLFRPPVPRSVLGTTAAYYKRFYLLTSVMEYHPKDIFLCCAYLAFKIEEYNVSVDEYVHVLAPELRQSVAETVLNNELLMLKRLKFHLTVHSPFRPLEGFLIDIKTRCPSINSPDSLRKEADEFLLRSLYSDVVLLYPPSQIALAALLHAANINKVDLLSYIKSQLLGAEAKENSSKLYHTLESINDTVRNVVIPESSKEVLHIEQRLEQCRIQELTTSPSRKRKSEDLNYDKATKRSKDDLDDEEDILPLTGFDRL